MVENPEDPVLELIHLVVNAVLCQEELKLASEMVHYQRNLSWQMFNHLSDLEGKPADIRRFCESFKTGWQEWKKNAEQKEESSFLIFMNSMKVDTVADLAI